jgi:mono/diheme cytochrome c family protein
MNDDAESGPEARTMRATARGGSQRRSSGIPKGRGTMAIAILLLATAVAGCSSTSHPTKPTSYAPVPLSYAGEAAARTLFQQNCSSCHMLAAANATFGTLGPDLDTLQPEEWSLRYQMENGGYVMPAFGVERILTHTQINAIAKYVVTVAGK